MSTEAAATQDYQPIAQGDGSIADAILAMPDPEADDDLAPPALGGRRDEPEAAAVADKATEGKEPEKKAEPDKDAKPAAKAEAPAATDDDEDIIEVPAETEGGAPERIKLSAALDAYRNLPKLTEELSKAKAGGQPMMPDQVEQEIRKVNDAATAHLNEVRALKQLYEPRPPNFNLSNPQHPEFNPEAWQSELTRFNRQVEMQAALADRETKVQAEIKARDEQTYRATINREAVKIKEAWPEFMTKPDVANAALKALREHYKFDDGTINSVIDHRFYALAKDALAYRALQGKQAEAAKVVKAKPRLIPAVARSKPNTDQTKRSDAYERLTQSGSLEDAAASIEF